MRISLLVLISTGLVVLWVVYPPAGDGTATSLFAGFVTGQAMLILKTAADAFQGR